MNCKQKFEEVDSYAFAFKLKSLIENKSVSAYPDFALTFKPDKDKLDLKIEKDKLSFSSTINELDYKDLEFTVKNNH